MSWGKASASCNITTSWSGPTSERDVRERRDSDVRRSEFEVPKTSNFGPRTLASRSSRPSRFQLQGARILADGGKQLQPALRHLSPLTSGWSTLGSLP